MRTRRKLNQFKLTLPLDLPSVVVISGAGNEKTKWIRKKYWQKY